MASTSDGRFREFHAARRERPPRRGAFHRVRVVVSAVLLALASGTAGASECDREATDGEPPRVAAINWGLIQTLVALDIAPVAAADAPGYRKWVVEPPLPASTIDIGRRIEPNLTVLAAARPGLITMSSYYDEVRRELARIAPVLTLDIHRPDSMPLPRARQVARCLARRFGREPELARLEVRFDSAIARLSSVVSERGGAAPVYVAQFRDAGHVRVYGENSLFGGVLEKAGLKNAWNGPTNFWGFATTPFTGLDQGDALLVIVEPVPSDAEAMMNQSPIWPALPAVRQDRVHRMPPVWAYGSLPSAVRFAELLAKTLHDAR